MMAIIGLLLVLFACVILEVGYLGAKVKLRDLVGWCNDGYELGISDDIKEFIAHYSNTDEGKKYPAYIQEDSVFIKGNLGEHRITWLGKKMYNDRAYIETTMVILH